MPGRVAVLHHARSFFPLDLAAAVGDEIELVWVLVDDASADRSLRRLLPRLGPVVDISGCRHEVAAARIAATNPEGIVTFVDDNLLLAAELATRVGLRYHAPETAAALANKQRQRERLSSAGVPGPRFWSLPRDEEALGRVSGDIVYPAVLKPAVGSGSRGIEALNGPRDVLGLARPEIEQFVEELLPDEPQRDRRFASYLSVETVVDGAEHDHVAITGRFDLAEPFRETGNFIPAAIAPSMHEGLFALTDAAIDALGITTGVLHTEIKLTPSGPRLIELNGRLGGRPPFVLQSVSNVNLFRAACELALGKRWRKAGLAECQGVGYWRMLQPPRAACRVRGVHGLDKIAAAPAVDTVTLHRGGGAAVDWREGTDGRVVTVRGRVASHDELAAAIAAIAGSVTIDYEMNGDDVDPARHARVVDPDPVPTGRRRLSEGA